MKALFIVMLMLSTAVTAQESEVEEPLYYRDGNRTIRLSLVKDEIFTETRMGEMSIEKVDPDAPKRVKEAFAVDDGTSLEDETLELPVFVTDTGQKIVPVGGVILVLDPSWTKAQCDAFIVQHDLSESAKVFEWLDNSYLIHTEPGLSAIRTANRLSVLDGVLISTPDLWTEVEKR